MHRFLVSNYGLWVLCRQDSGYILCKIPSFLNLVYTCIANRPGATDVWMVDLKERFCIWICIALCGLVSKHLTMHSHYNWINYRSLTWLPSRLPMRVRNIARPQLPVCRTASCCLPDYFWLCPRLSWLYYRLPWLYYRLFSIFSLSMDKR